MSLCRHKALTWPTVICGLDFAASQCAWFQWDCSRWRIKHRHYVHFPDTSTWNRLHPQGQAPHEYSQIMHISWLVFIFLIPTEPTCNLSFSSFLVQKPNTKRGPVWSREWPSPCFTLEQRMWASYKQTRVPLPRHKARIASHGKQSKKKTQNHTRVTKNKLTSLYYYCFYSSLPWEAQDSHSVRYFISLAWCHPDPC